MTFRAGWILCLGLALGAQAVPDRQIKSVIPVTEAYPDDPVLAKLIDPVKAKILATFGQVIGHAPEGLFKMSGQQVGPLGYWIADAMRARAEQLTGTPIKFALTNSGGIRSNLRPGPVKVGDIYEIMPFENELVVAELTGAEVLEVVKEGIKYRGGEPLSGILVRTGGSPEAPELVITWSDGSAIDPNQVVKFATSDYLIASSISLRNAKHAFTTGVSLRQVLLDLTVATEAQGKPILPPAGGRFEVAPEHLKSLRIKK
jgi:2',3'-cyclic-nucleotide 2'-phosphodiesterase (5'-nucleotidase family)